jgi:lipid II:glycine glycyltransferase (peptidoglycan interpeptide bridge formation enzyme)
MKIIEAQLKDKAHWNEFVVAQKMGGFTQSWEWGDFMKTQKEQTWRFFIQDEKNNWVATVFLFKAKLRFHQNTLNSPRGPVFKDDLMKSEKEVALKMIVEKINALAQTEKSLNFSCDFLSNDEKWLEIFKTLNLIKDTRNIQPKYTLVLNLEKSEEELLTEMHQKTRYNIRLAQKKGVKIHIDNSKLEKFYALLQKTENRKQVKFFSQKYFEKILKLPFVKLYYADYQGKIVAANIMIFWGKTATYLFGGTDNRFRYLMAPHILQWQAIVDAKNQGCKYYDFWGAATKGSSEEKKWGGVTRFKQGFAPQVLITEYLGTYEKIYQPRKLWLYRFVQRVFR